MTDVRATLGDSDDEFRASHIGASEVAALFEASPYLTLFELWHRRAGNLETPAFMADGMTNNDRIEAGLRLEPAIKEWAAARWGYIPTPAPRHITNGQGLGGHPDMCCTDDRGPGVVEIKTADWLIAKGWGDEPPLHYLLQAQTYAGLLGVSWCDIVVLIGGNRLTRYQYAFRPGIYAEIERRVAALWRSIRANDPPPPDFTRDRATLEDLLGEPTSETIDLRLDNAAEHAAAEWVAAKAEAKAADARADAARCELLEKVGEAGFALLASHKVSCSWVKPTPATLITPEMVGQEYGGRAGYRRFAVKPFENRRAA